MRINRLRFLATVMLAASCQGTGGSVAVGEAGVAHGLSVVREREYVVEQQLLLTNVGQGRPDRQNLWVALIRDFPPYQQVNALTISPDDYTLVVDEYGNHFAEFDLSDHPPGTTLQVSTRTEVAVQELAYDLTNCTGDLPTEFTQPELHVESANPQIVALAESLAAGKATACQEVRAFYDYLGDELTYTYNAESWGAQAALGPMGADCTEYSSLLMALSRARGIPARYFEGLRFVGADAEPGAQMEHAWADVYLPGAGWVPMDPTLGRSRLTRSPYFAHYPGDRIIITTGRNPSTLRGSSYWTHLYWPGNATKIRVEAQDWKIELAGSG